MDSRLRGNDKTDQDETRFQNVHGIPASARMTEQNLRMTK